MHPFDEAVRLDATAEDHYRGMTSPAYANMVGPFGGITTAQLLNAVMLHPERTGEPISMTVNFAGPVADGAFDIETALERTNRSTQHFSAKQIQGDDVQTTASVVLAKRRGSWSAGEKALPESLRTPGELPRSLPKGVPAWFNCYDMRALEGGVEALSGEEQAASLSRVWIRDDPPRPLTFPSLAAICDSFFPRIFFRLGRTVPVGTVSMTTYFHTGDDKLRSQSDRHVYGIAQGEHFENGYFEQSAEIWSDSNQLLASSHQIAYFRA